MACLELQQENPFESRAETSLEGVPYSVSDQTENQLFPILANKLLFYALVRDVHYSEGLKLIVPSDLSQEELEDKLGRVNAVTPCSAKLFSIPQ